MKKSYHWILSTLLLLACLTLACQSGGDSDVGQKNKNLIPIKHAQIELYKVGESKVPLGLQYNYDNFSGLTHQISGGKSRVLHLSNGQIFDFDPVLEKVNNYYKIPDKGPKKINPQSDFDGIIAINDQEYIYSANMINRLLLITQEKVEVLVDFKGRDDVFLVNSTQNRPIVTLKNEFVFGVSPDPTAYLAEEFAFLKFNSSDFSTTFVINFPNEYADNFYSTTPYLYWPSISVVDKNKEYIVSFPVSNYLYVYDDNFKLKKKVLAVSSQIEEVEVFSGPVKLGDYPEPEKEDRYFRELSYYFSLYVDEYNGYFYRVVKIRNSNAVLGYDYYLLVLNLEYEVIGEWKVPEHLRPFNMFCNEKGLNIYDVGALGITESGTATFSIYKPE